MEAIPFTEAAEKICFDLKLSVNQFLEYASEDEVGGYIRGRKIKRNQKWSRIGSVWEVEGIVLYTLVRILQPKQIIEVGGFVGCSTANMLAAVEKNKVGCITSVDIKNRLSVSSKLVNSVVSDGVEFAKNFSGSVDFVFEDGPHTLEFTRDICKNLSEKLTPGGVITMHDVEHPVVGAAVLEGARQALGDVGHVLIAPSDCGIGYWRKPF